MNKIIKYLSNLYNETIELNLKNKSKIIGVLVSKYFLKKDVDPNGNFYMNVAKIFYPKQKTFFVTEVVVRGSSLKYIVFPENKKIQEIFNELNKQ
uniref:mRNA splicing factor snRNP Sm-D n=1 Tax=Lotharella vacuolata TaxID=74820 RepID=A0A0H5BLB7_9EUKA|nr:mRNA splicing factor snRNP Sm-D [Lotharella vacuolata]